MSRRERGGGGGGGPGLGRWEARPGTRPRGACAGAQGAQCRRGAPVDAGVQAQDGRPTPSAPVGPQRPGPDPTPSGLAPSGCDPVTSPCHSRARAVTAGRLGEGPPCPLLLPRGRGRRDVCWRGFSTPANRGGTWGERRDRREGNKPYNSSTPRRPRPTVEPTSGPGTRTVLHPTSHRWGRAPGCTDLVLDVGTVQDLFPPSSRSNKSRPTRPRGRDNRHTVFHVVTGPRSLDSH